MFSFFSKKEEIKKNHRQKNPTLIVLKNPTLTISKNPYWYIGVICKIHFTASVKQDKL